MSDRFRDFGVPPRDPVFSSAILLGVSRIVGCHFGVYLSDLQFHLAGRLSQGRRLAQQAGGRVGRPTWRAPEGGLEDMGVAPALTAGRGRGSPFHSHEERNSASHGTHRGAGSSSLEYPDAVTAGQGLQPPWAPPRSLSHRNRDTRKGFPEYVR